MEELLSDRHVYFVRISLMRSDEVSGYENTNNVIVNSHLL